MLDYYAYTDSVVTVLAVHFMWVDVPTLHHTYLGSFFLNPEDIRKLGMGAIWNFAKQTGPL
jgi:hypothetical protein